MDGLAETISYMIPYYKIFGFDASACNLGFVWQPCENTRYVDGGIYDIMAFCKQW